jgi:hypothetical protein
MQSGQIVNSMMLRTLLVLTALLGPLSLRGLSQHSRNGPMPTSREVSFPTSDHGRICASLYGDGDHGVVARSGVAKSYNEMS